MDEVVRATKKTKALLLFTVAMISSMVVASQMFVPAYAPSSSVNAGVIGGPTLGCGFDSADTIINGGCLPIGDAAFSGFTFSAISVSPLGSLAGLDTLILNVASPGMACTTATLSAGEKADLVAAMTGGVKLIIYDSECPTADYTWLPASLQFNTNNPGAFGATGIGDIVEDNTLSSSVSGNAFEINMGTGSLDPNAAAGGLCDTIDACGDANVMVAIGAELCKDIDVTNVLGVTGTVHAYSKDNLAAGSGMLIYNGLDVDFAGPADVPTVGGVGAIAKLLLHELQQAWNPSGLPCNVPVVGLPVGGELLAVDMSALLVAGALTNAIWILPVLAAIAGAVIAITRIPGRKIGHQP